MNDKINIFEPKNKKKPLIVSKLRNKNKKVCFSCEPEKKPDDEKINNKSLNNQEDIISFEEDYLKKISNKSRFIENNFNNDNSYVRKTLKKKMIEQNNKENLRKSKKSSKNHPEKNLKYTEFISKVKLNVKNKENYYDDNNYIKSNLSNKSIKRINYNPNNSTDKVKNNPFCDFLNQFVNKNQRKTNIKSIKTIKANHNNNENPHDIYSKNQNIKINLFENLRIINNIKFYFQGYKNQGSNLNYIREKNDVILKLKVDLQNSENNIKELLSNIQNLKNELKIKENIIKELSMNNEKLKKDIESLNKSKKEDNLNINNNKFNNIKNNNNNIKADKENENYKNLITYNINKNNNYNIINSNINKIENINIIQNNKEDIINEEIKKKQNEREKKASRAFERFKRVNKSADADKQKNCKKSEKISEMAKMLEKNMENKNNLENSDEINKNNEYNDNIINIINNQPVVNKKKKKRNFSFDADFN